MLSTYNKNKYAASNDGASTSGKAQPFNFSKQCSKDGFTADLFHLVYTNTIVIDSFSANHLPVLIGKFN